MAIQGTQADMIERLDSQIKEVADTIVSGDKPKGSEDWSEEQWISYYRDLKDKGIELGGISNQIENFSKDMTNVAKDFGTKNAKSFNFLKQKLSQFSEDINNTQYTNDNLENDKFKDANDVKIKLDSLDHNSALDWLSSFFNEDSLIVDENSGKTTEALSLAKDFISRFYSSQDEQEKLELCSIIFDKLIPEGKKETINEEGEIPVTYEENIKAKVSMNTEIENYIKKIAKQDAGNVKKSFNLQKNAQAKTVENVIMFGPEGNKPDAFTGMLINDWHLVERNKGFGLRVDDVYNIDWENTWRKNIMDKYFRSYKDKDGNWVGGYIESRFEVDKNVPPTNDYQLKPGEIRKPFVPEFSHTEARLEAARTQMNKERDYSPASKGEVFNWKEAQSKKANFDLRLKHELKTFFVNNEEFVGFDNSDYSLPSDLLNKYGIQKINNYYAVPKAKFYASPEIQDIFRQIGVHIPQQRTANSVKKNTKFAQYTIEEKNTVSGSPSYIIKDNQGKIIAAYSSSKHMFGDQAKALAEKKLEELNGVQKQAQVDFEQVKYDFISGEEKAKKMTTEELHYAIKDLKKTIEIQEQSRREGGHVPKLGYYWDEYHTYVQELNKRKKIATTKSLYKLAELPALKAPRDIFKDPEAKNSDYSEWCPRCGGLVDKETKQCKNCNKVGLNSQNPTLGKPITEAPQKGQKLNSPVQQNNFVQRNQVMAANVAKEIYFDGNSFYCFAANDEKKFFKTYKEAKGFKQKSPSDILTKQRELRPKQMKQLISDPFEDSSLDDDLDNDEVTQTADNLGIDG